MLPALLLAALAAAPQSDALKAPRPKGGEYFGLYLMNKKVGYVFQDLRLDAKDPTRAIADNLIYFKASVGGKTTERRFEVSRVYEAKPHGRLLSFQTHQTGDGGDQDMEATATPQGVHVIVKRRGMPNEVKTLKAAQETIEDADPVRVALLRHAPVEGTVIDETDLESYAQSARLAEPVERVFRGVSLKLQHAVLYNDKEKVPADTYVTASGAMIEQDFGQNMKGIAEPEADAKRLDSVEVFSLTRVALPYKLPPDAQAVPRAITWVLSGLPETFFKDDYRQRFKKLDGGKVEVTVTAQAPDHPAPVRFPLRDPKGGENLKNTLAMELDNPDLRAKAHELVKGEKDAYAAAKKIVAWVAAHMVSDYGASSDRAADALHRLRGDCTEHSLLSVAMLRAVGIPAKRIDGLVYMVNGSDGVPALYWHEWVEAYVGQWTQLDPTFDEPVTDAAHLAVGAEGSAEITPLIGQLKVEGAKVTRL